MRSCSLIAGFQDKALRRQKDGLWSVAGFTDVSDAISKLHPPHDTVKPDMASSLRSTMITLFPIRLKI
ncbi:MAG: hypothetical protein NTV50_03040 [Planctomycetota bacterium]|nr:hypothetical protein [Planctomycetota bacterium]